MQMALVEHQWSWASQNPQHLEHFLSLKRKQIERRNRWMIHLGRTESYLNPSSPSSKDPSLSGYLQEMTIFASHPIPFESSYSFEERIPTQCDLFIYHIQNDVVLNSSRI